jgi:hypothetical protein
MPSLGQEPMVANSLSGSQNCQKKDFTSQIFSNVSIGLLVVLLGSECKIIRLGTVQNTALNGVRSDVFIFGVSYTVK